MSAHKDMFIRKVALEIKKIIARTWTLKKSIRQKAEMEVK